MTLSEYARLGGLKRQANRKEPEHGTESRYSGQKHGCRCLRCRTAHREYRRADREALYRAGLTSEGKRPKDAISRGRGMERFRKEADKCHPPVEIDIMAELKKALAAGKPKEGQHA